MNNQNKQDLYEIRTKLGSALKVTGKHPVFSPKLGRIIEIPVSELVVGDKLLARKCLAPAEIKPIRIVDLLLDCSEPVFVQVRPELVLKAREKLSSAQISRLFGLHRDYDYTEYKRGKAALLTCWLEVCQSAGISEDEFLDSVLAYKTRSSRRLILPKFIDAELGWFAGIVATDGYMFRQASDESKPGFYGSWKIKLGNTDIRITEKFGRIASSLGLHVSRHVHKQVSKLSRKPLMQSEVSSPILQHLLVKLGTPTGGKSYKMRAASVLFFAPPEVRGAYLAGLIDGNGSVSKTDRHIRLHSAAWGLLSDACMLLRGFGIPATCYTEDYLCKAAVMKAATDYGYSLGVTSNEDYEVFRNAVGVHMCKELLPKMPESRPGFAHARKSRRVCVRRADNFWLEDTVLEIVRVPYKGPVLNWRVELGNQLVVDGILTHNCGRGGRDGKPAWCKLFFSAQGLSTARFFVQTENPSETDVRSVFRTLETLSKVAPSITISTWELGQMSGLHDKAVGTVLTRLKAARVIERSEERPTIAGVEFTPGLLYVTPTFAETRDAIYDNVLETKGNTLLFDILTVADRLGIADTTLKGRLYGARKEGLLKYYPPFRGTPMRIVGDLRQMDFDKLREQARVAELKLQQVIDYHATPDKEKHDYLESIFQPQKK